MNITLRVALVCLLPCAGVCQSLPFELEFDRLPSEQGWAVHANYEESRVVSLADGILTFNTAKGFTPVAGGYRLRSILETNTPVVSISFRARVSANASPGSVNSYLDIDLVPPGGVIALLRIDGDEVSLSTGARSGRVPVDTSEFHEYRLDAIRGVGDILYVDGMLTVSAASSAINREIDNDIFMGVQRTVSGTPHILAELTRFRVENSNQSLDQPIVTCAAPSVAPCDSPVQVSVAVADPNGDAMNVSWQVNGQSLAVNTMAVSDPLHIHHIELPLDLPVGLNHLRLEVNDGASESVVVEKTILIEDVINPVITEASARPNPLWSHFNQMFVYSFDAVVADDCPFAYWEIQDAYRNVSGGGRDIMILDDHTIGLRASRGWHRQGSAYTVLLLAIDAAGNESELFPVEVVVPNVFFHGHFWSPNRGCINWSSFGSRSHRGHGYYSSKRKR